MKSKLQKRARIIFTGTVQGVGFRWTAERIAHSLSLPGWVMNCPDGSVKVVCEGDEKRIYDFVEKIEEALGYYIHGKTITWHEATGEFNSFSIAFYDRWR
jgi:acylphosphatase